MDDGIRIATRERVISSDFNNMQSMLARRADDVLRYVTRNYRMPAGSIGSTTPAYENCVSGLEVNIVDSTHVQVSPGILCMEAPPNVTQGALDSPFRVGVLRQAVTVEVPLENTRYMIAARLVEVEVTQESRDVRDPATDSFTSQPVVKQVEMQVEIGVYTDNNFSYPAMNALGDEWEALGFFYMPTGSTPDVQDCRREIRDIDYAGPSFPASVNDDGKPIFLQRDLWSTQASDDDNPGPGQWFRGNFEVRHKGQIYRMWDDPDANWFPPVVNAGNPGNGAVAHMYVVPMIDLATGRKRVLTTSAGTWPADPTFGERNMQGGIIVSSDVAPSVYGTNSAPLSIGIAPFGNYSTVPTGDAVHLFSATQRSDFNATGWFRPFIVDGNEFLYTNASIINTNFTDGFMPIIWRLGNTFPGAPTTGESINGVNLIAPAGFGPGLAYVPPYAKAIKVAAYAGLGTGGANGEQITLTCFNGNMLTSSPMLWTTEERRYFQSKDYPWIPGSMVRGDRPGYEFPGSIWANLSFTFANGAVAINWNEALGLRGYKM